MNWLNKPVAFTWGDETSVSIFLLPGALIFHCHFRREWRSYDINFAACAPAHRWLLARGKIVRHLLCTLKFLVQYPFKLCIVYVTPRGSFSFRPPSSLRWPQWISNYHIIAAAALLADKRGVVSLWASGRRGVDVCMVRKPLVPP